MVALFGDKLKRKLWKPKLKFKNVLQTEQNSFINFRLVIENDSNNIAEQVEFDILEVKDNDTLRSNFIPAPHSWTHIENNSLRDIFPHQTVYLDIIRMNVKYTWASLCAPVILPIRA
ncbi:MAG: hypothetical protein IPL31_04755 [Saprospiraceae bacterium]|nr:hypothetical protein [Saprospiraceae bacterium]